jgi:hypothetical protein
MTTIFILVPFPLVSRVDASADRALLSWADDRGSGSAVESADTPVRDACHSVVEAGRCEPAETPARWPVAQV